jgi:hypothetical protein
MHRRWRFEMGKPRTFAIAIACLISMALSRPAMACRVDKPINLEDIKYADLVVVGRLTGYRIVRDEEFRRKMLANPNLSPAMKNSYQGSQTLAGDYGELSIKADRNLKGKTPMRLKVSWHNSTFGLPETLKRGVYLFALRRNDTKEPRPVAHELPLFSGPAIGDYTLLQAPCSYPFMFNIDSDEARKARSYLSR